MELAAEHSDDALQLVAGDSRGQRLANFEQQRRSGFVQPAEHRCAVNAVQLGERIAGDLVKVPLTQQVPLADIEGCQASPEGLLEGGAIGVPEHGDLGVVAVADPLDEGLVTRSFGALAGAREVDDQT